MRDGIRVGAPPCERPLTGFETLSHRFTNSGRRIAQRSLGKRATVISKSFLTDQQRKWSDFWSFIPHMLSTRSRERLSSGFWNSRDTPCACIRAADGFSMKSQGLNRDW